MSVTMSLESDLHTGNNYYAEGQYCQTNVKRGVTRTRAGVRLMTLTTDFLVGFRRAIMDECGPAADTVFASCGRKWGGFLAKRFETEMSDYHGKPLQEMSLAKIQALLADLFSHHGWGNVSTDLTRHEQGLVIITAEQPIFAAISGPSEAPVDSLLAGILSGFFSTIFESDLDCVQTTCQARGEASSKFVLGLTARMAGARGWVDSGKTHDQILVELAAIRV